MLPHLDSIKGEKVPAAPAAPAARTIGSPCSRRTNTSTSVTGPLASETQRRDPPHETVFTSLPAVQEPHCGVPGYFERYVYVYVYKYLL